MIAGKDLENRDGGSQSKPGRGVQTAATSSAADRLALLEQRLVEARELKPSGKAQQHCADCFRHGRDAVLQLLGRDA